MPQSLEERVAYLEGRVSDHTQAQSELREMVVHLDQKVDRFREELAARISALEQSVNAWFQSVNDQIDALDQSLSTRIDVLNEKVDRQFKWLVGIQITVLVAVVSALIAALLQ